MIRGIQRAYLQERILYGRPAAEAVAEEVAALGKERAFVLTNRSLSTAGGLAARIVQGLGKRCVGSYAGITAHSPRTAVLEGAAQARTAQADLLIAVGGGSVIDATKLMLACLWHHLTQPEQLDPYRGAKGIDPSRRPPGMEAAIRMLAVPTTFSAAEFTHIAGVTDTVRGVKEGFGHALFTPQVVVLDPEATLNTPLELLLSTGIKAVDHAVERLYSKQATPYSDATASEALSLLTRALRGIKVDPAALEPRAEGQMGMWLSITGGMAGVGSGVSHAIGHTLGGSYGVPHGITSCVVLPSALRWNASVTQERQQRISHLMGRAGIDAGLAVAELVAQLELPGRLRDVGIRREDFQVIAEHTMHDAPVRTNPRKIERPEEIMEILDMAW